MKREDYIFSGTDFYTVRNRNEGRVLKSMAANKDIQALNDPGGDTARDIYAMALNLLSPRYTQSGTIVLRDPVRKSSVDEAVCRALQQVLNHPKT
jgi:hypothetical protein